MKFTTIILLLSVIFASAVSFSAQIGKPPNFNVNTLVNKNGKSKETSSRLIFGENSLKIIKRGKTVSLKEFKYSDIKSVEYSNNKTPRFSNGKMIALTALAASTIGGIVVVPLMFLKVKQHWISVRTENDFFIFRINEKKLRLIAGEFENRNILLSADGENISPK